MDISSLIESAISHKKHLEVAYTQFQFNIHPRYRQEFDQIF